MAHPAGRPLTIAFSVRDHFTVTFTEVPPSALKEAFIMIRLASIKHAVGVIAAGIAVSAMAKPDGNAGKAEPEHYKLAPTPPMGWNSSKIWGLKENARFATCG